MQGDWAQIRDGERVHECLKKALKIASQCMDPAAQTQLFVEVLNHNILFFHRGCKEVHPLSVHPVVNSSLTSQVTAEYVSQLVSKIRETLPSLEPSPETEHMGKAFANTVALLAARKEAADSPVDYRGIVL